MKKRITAIFLILLSAFTLVSCKAETPQSSQTAESSAASAEAAAPAPTADQEGYVPSPKGNGEFGDWDYPMDHTVTITQVVNSAEELPFEKNGFYQLFLERYDILVENMWVSNDYDTRINLAIASGDLPDVFQINPTQMAQMMDAGRLKDLTEAYDQYASEDFKYLASLDADVWNLGKRENKLLALSRMHFGNITKPTYIWLRKDWMNEAKLTAPSSISDLEQIMETYKEKYGAAIGIGMNQELDALMDLAPSFHAYPKSWIPGNDGSIIYGQTAPEMKTALQKFAEWYGKGYIDPAFVSKDFDAVNKDIINGATGVRPFQQWLGYAVGKSLVEQNSSDSYFIPFPLPSSDDKPVQYAFNFSGSEYIGINANASDEVVQAAIKLLNWNSFTQIPSKGALYDEVLPKGGPKAHRMRDTGWVEAGAFTIFNAQGDYEQQEYIAEALETGDDTRVNSFSNAKFKYDFVKSYMETKDLTALGDYLQQGPEGAYRLGKKILDDGDFFLSPVNGPYPQVLNNYGGTLDSILLEGFTKIIIGTEPIDYFDTVIADWKKAGGQECTDAINSAYGLK